MTDPTFDSDFNIEDLLKDALSHNPSCGKQKTSLPTHASKNLYSGQDNTQNSTINSLVSNILNDPSEIQDLLPGLESSGNPDPYLASSTAQKIPNDPTPVLAINKNQSKGFDP